MVYIKSFFGAAALLSTLVQAAPAARVVGRTMPEASSSAVMAHETSSAMAHEATSSAMVHEASSSAMAHETTSTAMAHETSTAMAHETTSAMAHETTSTMVHETTSAMVHETTSSEAAKATYGSGSYSGGSGYDDCVQKCMASFGTPSATATATATTETAAAGTGATHTVIVAPTQGVLRYVPFAVNASVGDTIFFKWNANNHTVTKSDVLLPCNKSSSPEVFASGVQVKDFTFTQVVNTTDPTFFFCAVPGHCTKGMFGIINPPSELNAPTSVAGQMSNMTKSNPDMVAKSSYVTKLMAEKAPAAAAWGGNINLAALPDWSHPLVAENVLYTRSFVANNVETLQSDGRIDLSSAGTTPLMWPQELAVAAAATSPSSAATASSPSSTASEAPAVNAGADSASAAAPSNGAMSSASPSIALGLVTAVAAFLLL